MQEKILVTGATGYIGGRLVPCLLENNYQVRVMTRDARHMQGRSWLRSVEVMEADVLKPETLEAALEGIDMAYYLVHNMSDHEDFSDRDSRAAQNFAEVAQKQGVNRIIYLGGLGQEDQDLSEHLESRHQVGQLLGSAGVPVTEFRAAVVVGSGSSSFEMVRYLTERLPMMIAPEWVYTRTQPISIRDVLNYLVAALETPESTGEVIEIGGADVIAYKEMIMTYADKRDLNRYMLRVPFFTPRLSSYWVHLFTPVPHTLVRPLVESLRHEMVVTNDRARQIFPEIEPVGYDTAVDRALDALQADQVETTWTDSMASTWEEEEPYTFVDERGMLIERRKRTVQASPEKIYRAFTQLGGENGWLYLNWLWRLRGRIDRWLGGPGYRRGRRSPDSLRVGDTLDFWRVEAIKPDRMMRLRAEMKTGGRAWLQYNVEPQENGQSKLVQTAYFAPHGLTGNLYWVAMFIPHLFIFDGMIDKIVAEAEDKPHSPTEFSDVRFLAGSLGMLTAAVLAIWQFARNDR